MTFYMQEKQKCDTLIEHIRNLKKAITAWKSAEHLTEGEVDDFLLHRDEDESQGDPEPEDATDRFMQECIAEGIAYEVVENDAKF